MSPGQSCQSAKLPACALFIKELTSLAIIKALPGHNINELTSLASIDRSGMTLPDGLAGKLVDSLWLFALRKHVRIVSYLRVRKP